MTTTGISARPPSLSEWIAAALTKEIVLGEIQPGTVLREADVAVRFNTSRGPCREAFSILARRGFLETAPYRANVVTVLAEPEIRELTECRLLIDPVVASLAAERATEAQVARLQELSASGDAAAEAGNRAAFYETVRELRLLLLEAAGNRFLQQLAETITHQSDRLRLASIESATELMERSRRMSEIVAAIARRDGDAAASRMKEGIAAAERAALKAATAEGVTAGPA